MFRGQLPIRAEKTKDFDVFAADNQTIVNIQLWRCNQSSGYKTKFQEIPNYYAIIRTPNKKYQYRTTSIKTLNQWLAQWDKLPKPQTI